LPTITGTLSACIGNTAQLTGSGTAATTNAWSSSSTAVAIISGTGLLTGVSVGTSTITYINSNGCQITANVTVSSQITTSFLPIVGCLNGVVSLPTQSQEGITGTWLPNTINTATLGTNSYAFTPDTSIPSQSCAVAGSLSVTINALPTITGTLVACVGNTTQLAGSATAATTNAWTSSNTSVATISATGLITGVNAGTSTITYINSNGCQVTAIITINGLPTITGTLSACIGNTTQLIGSGTASTTNAWSSSNTAVATVSATGLVTGISIGTSTITYINSNGCQSTATFAANALTTPDITFSYAQTCINATNPLPVLTPNFAAGGVYSSPTVTVNPATGAVSLATATAGLHVITYALAANLTTCTANATSVANLIITSGVNPVTGFNYNSNYCATSPNALPSTSAGFTAGGTFTATPSGLTINNTSGEINISGSSSGTYNVVYSIAENATTCTIADSNDFTLTISAIPVVVIDDICENQELVLEALPVNSSFNPNDVTYTWSVSNTPILGSNTSKFNVDDYLTQTSANLPLQLSVSVSLNGCAGFDDFDVAYNPCKNIPRGISPNDDGDNDTFDLTGMGVKEITIFNRYGVNVFYYNGTYTNQWSGQSDQGDKLPDGTYFYSIHTVDGTSKTGWVYINRQY
jgi:gliding motility-associated-like protein